ISLSSLVDSIDLANKGTTRPRLKATVAPQVSALNVTTKSPKEDSGVAIYRVINRKTDTTCILLKTDAVVEVKFKLHGIETQADSFIPEDAMVVGECDQEESVVMTIVWPGYSITMAFAKTPGGEVWFLKNVALTASVDIPQFHGIKTRDKTLRLYNESTLVPTPVGKSYLCEEVDINLKTDPADHPPKDVYGTLLLRMLQVQAFMYKSENFSTSFQCKNVRGFRSETTPIAVGSTLAIVALAIIAGYGAFRYFKVKNVQYNTME
ncbi:hypothetical protein D910_07306, partial [Dendroctonus ponderosae]